MIGLGSQSELGIGISVQLYDQFSGKARQINAQLLSMKKMASSAVWGAIRDYRNQSAMIAGGAIAVSYGMMRMAKSGAEFQHIINQAAIVGGKDLGRSRQQLMDFASQMSKEFTQSPTSVAKVMAENVRAGVTEGLELITKYQIAVGVATNEAIEGEQGVAKGLLGIMYAMNMTQEEFPRVANAVTQAANISMASVYDINESMQYFGNTARIANLTLEETLALVARLSMSNIRGSMAGTALSNMIVHGTQSVGMFAGPKKIAAIKAAGLDQAYMGALMNEARWYDLIKYVDKGVQGLSYLKKAAVLYQTFGIRGDKALVNLFGSKDPNKNLDKMLADTKAGVAADISMRQSKAMMNDLYSDLKFIGQAFERFKNAFVLAAGPTLRVVFGFVTKVINFLTGIINTPIGRIFTGIAVVAAPVIAIMFAFRAAVLTATLALRSLSTSRGIGFMSLVQGGLGQAGINGVGNLAGKFGPAGANGLRRVLAGQEVNIAGKLYKGGQYLPRALFEGAGMGLGAKAGSFFSKATPWLGRIGGFASKALGYLGWIGLAVTILSGIYEVVKGINGKQEHLDPIFTSYYKHLDEQLFGLSMSAGYYDKNADRTGTNLDPNAGNAAQLNQNINVNVDGRPVLGQALSQMINGQMDNQMNFEAPDIP